MCRGFFNDRTEQVPQIHPLSSTSTKWRPDEPAYWFASHVATKFVGTSGPPQETTLLCEGNQSAITLASAWIAVRSRYILACATAEVLRILDFLTDWFESALRPADPADEPRRSMHAHEGTLASCQRRRSARQ